MMRSMETGTAQIRLKRFRMQRLYCPHNKRKDPFSANSNDCDSNFAGEKATFSQDVQKESPMRKSRISFQPVLPIRMPEFISSSVPRSRPNKNIAEAAA